MESYMYKSHLQVAVSDYRALASVIKGNPAYLTAAAGMVVIPGSTVLRLYMTLPVSIVTPRTEGRATCMV